MQVNQLPNEILDMIFDELPLHMRAVSRSVCKQWYDFIGTKNIKRFHYTAAGHGHINIILWGIDNGIVWNDNALVAAAENGRIDVLEWAIKTKKRILLRNNNLLMGELCAYAARHGRLNVLQWIHSTYYTVHRMASVEAAASGSLHILDWLNDKKVLYTEGICFQAVLNDRPDVLMWYHANGFSWPSDIASTVAASGDLSTLKRIHELGAPINYRVCENAAVNGHLDVLKWARAQGLAWGGTCYDAARYNHKHVLNWAIENGAPVDHNTCEALAERGDLDTLRQVMTDGIYSVYRAAVKYGRLEIYKWLVRTFGRCEEDDGDEMIELAIKHNQRRILEWECTIAPTIDLCYYAAKHGNLNILKWARAQGYTWGKGICEVAADNGHLEILKWARANGCPWDILVCYSAVRQSNVKVLKWALENGAPWDDDICDYSIRNSHYGMIKWIHDNVSITVPSLHRALVNYLESHNIS